MKKCIWIINQYAGSPIHGMVFRNYYLASNFEKLDVKAYVISGSFSHLYNPLPPTTGQFTFEKVNNVDYCWVKTPTYGKSASIGRIWSMILFMLKLLFLPTHKFQKPDVVIVSSPSLFPAINGWLLKRKFNCQLVFEIRDLWPMSVTQLGNISTKHPLIVLFSMVEKFAYQKADYVVSLLPNIVEHLRNLGIDDKKFRCVPNGIDMIEDMKEKKVSIYDLRKKHEGKFILGYTGTIGTANAMEYMLQAMKKIELNTSIQLVLIGDGGEKEKYMEQYKDSKNISFYDAVPKNEIQAIINEFDVCYIGWHNSPLYRYGVSANKIFEYMLAAKPILHSINAYNDPVQDANAGITVGAEDVEAISEAILKLHQMSEEQLKQLGQNGYNYVIENHSYLNLAKKYLRFLFPDYQG